jgi:hypothetical protein
MRPVHEEPVEVARRGEPPEQFLLHDRLYLVRSVLARWVEPGGWRWSGPGRVRPLPAAVGGGPDGAAEAPAGRPPVIHSVPVDLADRELWRVEAAPGREARPAVFDLCRDRTDERARWTATLVEE